MNTLKQLEAAPRNLILYAWGLVGAVVDDYALVTLLIFAVLLGFLTTALIAAAAFFGLYFLLRLVANIADVIDRHARITAQANMQTAAAISNAAALATGNTRSGQVVEGDLLP